MEIEERLNGQRFGLGKEEKTSQLWIDNDIIHGDQTQYDKLGLGMLLDDVASLMLDTKFER